MYRLVSADILNVRLKPSNKATVLGKLYFGQVVMLVEKNRDWVLISWSDEDKGLALQGWVFSRYVEKLE